MEAHDGIRRFSFGDTYTDFTIALDHTTGYNPRSYSKYARIFLDGVFGYLVHYRGKHVMTIGFSIVRDHTILLQQIQLVTRRGNRFLYRLPHHLAEFVIDRMRVAFPRYCIYLIEGGCTVDRSIRDYGVALEKRKKECADYMHASDRTTARWRELAQQECKEYEERIAHLEKEAPRIRALYANTGKYSLGKTLVRNDTVHRLIM